MPWSLRKPPNNFKRSLSFETIPSIQIAVMPNFFWKKKFKNSVDVVYVCPLCKNLSRISLSIKAYSTDIQNFTIALVLNFNDNQSGGFSELVYFVERIKKLKNKYWVRVKFLLSFYWGFLTIMLVIYQSILLILSISFANW